MMSTTRRLLPRRPVSSARAVVLPPSSSSHTTTTAAFWAGRDWTAGDGGGGIVGYVPSWVARPSLQWRTSLRHASMPPQQEREASGWIDAAASLQSWPSLDPFLTPHPWDLEAASAVGLSPLAGGEWGMEGAEVESESFDSTALLKADRVSRHVLQLLHELAIHRHPVTKDRATTERCLAALKRLLRDVPPSCVGRADRAKAILEGMEFFRYANNDDPAHRRTHLPPIPNRDVYQAVLRVYASTENHDMAPHWALEVVERMRHLHEVEGRVELKPHAFHWNCVLLAWQRASRWDRSLEAAKIVLERPHAVWDSSTHVFLWRTCAPRPSSGSRNDKEAELGAKVAVKIWQATVERDNPDDGDEGAEGGSFAGESQEAATVPELPSHAYAHFLQAIRSLPPGALRDAYYRAALERAIDRGKLNAVILNEVLVHNSDKSLFEEYLRPHYDSTWRALSPAAAAERLLQRVPSEWHRHAEHPNNRRHP